MTLDGPGGFHHRLEMGPEEVEAIAFEIKSMALLLEGYLLYS